MKDYYELVKYQKVKNTLYAFVVVLSNSNLLYGLHNQRNSVYLNILYYLLIIQTLSVVLYAIYRDSVKNDVIVFVLRLFSLFILIDRKIFNKYLMKGKISNKDELEIKNILFYSKKSEKFASDEITDSIIHNEHALYYVKRFKIASIGQYFVITVMSILVIGGHTILPFDDDFSTLYYYAMWFLTITYLYFLVTYMDYFRIYRSIKLKKANTILVFYSLYYIDVMGKFGHRFGKILDYLSSVSKFYEESANDSSK